MATLVLQNRACGNKEAHRNWSHRVAGTPVRWGQLDLCRRNLDGQRPRHAIIAWPDKLGTDPMAVGGLDLDAVGGIVRRKQERNPWVRTRFSRVWRMSELTRDGTAESVSRDQILRREQRQRNIRFFPLLSWPLSLQDRQTVPVDGSGYNR